MIRRSWRYVLAFVVLLALIAAGGFWYWNRPAPQPTLEQLPQADGSVMTRVTPNGSAKARVAVAVMADETQRYSVCDPAVSKTPLDMLVRRTARV